MKTRVARARPSMNESCHKYLKRIFSFLAAGVFTFFLLTAVFSQVTFSNTSADLSITKSSLSDPIIAGEGLTYSVKVSNAGPSDAVNVVITETYEASFLFSSSTPSPDSGTTNCWTFKTITAGDSETISITGTTNTYTLGSVSNQVSLTSSTADQDPLNNTFTLDTSIETSADLNIEKSGPSVGTAGEEITYTLNLSNSGPSDAQNVVITENYDSNFLFSSSSLFPDSGTNNQWTFKIIKAGDSETISITGSIAPSAAGFLFNSVTLTSDTADPDPDNNSTSLSSSILSRLSH